MSPQTLVEIQVRFFGAREIIELRGITRLPGFGTASEIDVSLADDLFNKKVVKGCLVVT